MLIGLSRDGIQHKNDSVVQKRQTKSVASRTLIPGLWGVGLQIISTYLNELTP